MKKIKCIIADDEPIAREILAGYMARIEGMQLVVTCGTGGEVISALLQHTVDLVFLDIQMPQLTGIELLRAVPAMPPVVLTTAYSEFALESYQYQVVDYLLKPIAFEHFARAVQKFNRHLQVLPAFAAASQTQPFIYVRSDKKMVKVMLNQVLYIEGLKDYVQIHLQDKKIITHQTLNSFEETLPYGFLRCHRSFIVALSFVDAYTARYLEVGNREIPIGEAYAAIVADELKGAK